MTNMLKQFARYMKDGKEVESSYTGAVFKLIQGMDENKPTVLAVNMENWKRYSLLKAWSNNHVGVTDEQRAEMEGYEESLEIEAVVPHNTIRFITPDYEPKFEVKDLDRVLVNGKAARVAYLDEYHFTFADTFAMNLWGGCFHICQFAELCESNGIEVQPMRS